jgi:hypothetical protein
VAQELAQAQALAAAQTRAAPEDLASRWSPAMEKLARHAMKKATRLAWQYEAIADAARRLNGRLSILSGLLGALVGTGSLVGAATPVSVNPSIGLGSASWPTVVSVVIGYAISVIAVLVTNWRLSEIQSKGVTAKVGLLNTARDPLAARAAGGRPRRRLRVCLRARGRDRPHPRGGAAARGLGARELSPRCRRRHCG